MSGGVTLWHWTDDRERAAAADAAGVDRIGVDIERLGKAERQPGGASWISRHRIEDLAGMRPRVSRARLFIRVNAIHDGTAAEVDAALAAGAEVLMLPNFTTLAEVARLVDVARGRAEVVPLVERAAALPLIAGLSGLGVRSFHVGLNDLALDLGMGDRLALLAHPALEGATARAREAGLRFGLGGVARPEGPGLRVPADLVVAQHARLGSTGAMLARSFWGPDLDAPGALGGAVARLRARFDHWAHAGHEAREDARRRLAAITGMATA